VHESNAVDLFCLCCRRSTRDITELVPPAPSRQDQTSAAKAAAMIFITVGNEKSVAALDTRRRCARAGVLLLVRVLRRVQLLPASSCSSTTASITLAQMRSSFVTFLFVSFFLALTDVFPQKFPQKFLKIRP
jgi:hypothetical protein